MVDAGTTRGLAGPHADACPATHSAGGSAATRLPAQLRRVLRTCRIVRAARPHDADERARRAHQRRALAVVTLDHEAAEAWLRTARTRSGRRPLHQCHTHRHRL